MAAAPESEYWRALLVAVETPDQTEDTDELLEELAELAKTFGAEVVDKLAIRIDRPQSRLLIGSGAAEEIVERLHKQNADIILFDHDLSPSQQRNWEKLADCPVIDRREVILDIFAARASTREAVLQVGLAQAEYQLPRLKRAWTHLSRQRGNTKMRGEGEKQIEIDERLVRKRIARLRQELKRVRQRRSEQRKKRRQKPVPNAAIVGYTNAGKSMMLNRLTHSRVTVEDKLFATLDPTTRQILLPNNQVLLLTDTVGFVRRLPHTLVESFKATLEEALVADFLIHVIDISSQNISAHDQTARQVLAEIGAEEKFTITVFNKIDKDLSPLRLGWVRRDYPEAIFVSMKTGEGLDQLIQKMQETLNRGLFYAELRIPQRQYDIVALLHRTSHIHEEHYEDNAVCIRASIPPDCRAAVTPFLIPSAPHLKETQQGG